MTNGTAPNNQITSEHARRSRTRWRTVGLGWHGWRWSRPLVGGIVGTAIIVAFLAIRGGTSADPVDPLTGVRLGGWSRVEDVHLLLVVNGAIAVGLLVGFLAEYVRHWLSIYMTLMLGGVLLGIREFDAHGQVAEDALLAVVIVSVVAAAAIGVADLVRHRTRAGY